MVAAVTSDSRAVRDGTLFVAVAGTVRDGHAFIGDAVSRGAAAIVVEREEVAPGGVTVVVVPDTARALASLAAAFHGHPGRRVPLIGITGTIGKTSVLALLDAILVADGRRPGAIGSLGVSVGGVRLDSTEHTTPDAVRLHEELAEVVAAGCDIIAMEVTSHALVQRRVHGLCYALGIFTNLVPLEHGDYHGSFRAYVDAKLRFFDHLGPDAPLIYNSDDRSVRALARDRARHRIGVSLEAAAAVRLHSRRLLPGGTHVTLSVRKPLRTLAGDEIAPFDLPLSLQLRGIPALNNAGLAAAAALCAGARAEAVASALTAFTPRRRRTEVLHTGAFTVIDDTVGHPESISALFRVVRSMRPRQLHIAFAIRGRRGPAINRHLAQALAVYARRLPVATLIVTSGVEATDERNRVRPDERAAFLGSLAAAGIAFEETERLDAAVTGVLERARPGDLVLLLGAQGMDPGAAIARSWLESGGAGN